MVFNGVLLSLPTMRSKFTLMTGRKQVSLQSRGTGNGNVFPLGFVTQLLSLRGRLPVS